MPHAYFIKQLYKLYTMDSGLAAPSFIWTSFMKNVSWKRLKVDTFVENWTSWAAMATATATAGAVEESPRQAIQETTMLHMQ